MITALFLQSDVDNPYSVYKSMLNKNPIYWDEYHKIWAIYSYEYCVQILKNPNAFIPAIIPNDKQKLNEHAFAILNNLTRLSNGIEHEAARDIAMLLFSNIKSVAINEILSGLIQNNINENKIDWVDSVCKKLPLLVVLKSFGFAANDCVFVLDKIEILVKIMLPTKTEEQIKSINEISETLFLIAEKRLSELDFYNRFLNKTPKSQFLSPDEIMKISISNLIGLFIQSYDAGRGILSNSLLQILSNKSFSDKDEIQKSIIETLRFDPPIHNTRRIANEDITIGESLIKKNDTILIVLASANRDSKKFENPLVFDFERNNNNENLTFGIGGHMCIAKHFSIHLATETLCFLFKEYNTISLLENNIEYEPMINARLPKNIWISIA
ncbi:cytochrome P450 [Flavobacterium aquidurense]|uniref:Cytochrome P450 n=1 Tax=Flavobacterium aquidurense TaxID=362413 RepID=A0A0Q0S7W7_9FLAO|nr:cytochrome P450 [Flavobacterium aquidurense]KQB41638.1 Cytochrome P450 [Flavobacterium aquidurense]